MRQVNTKILDIYTLFDSRIAHCSIKNFSHYPSKEEEGEDYIDLGAATLDFYSSLVDLLAKCAPDPLTIQAGKGESLRARAILRSLISLDDLGNILALRFTIPNLAAASIDGNPSPALLLFLRLSELILILINCLHSFCTCNCSFFRLKKVICF
jgi:hypothetical protein